MTRRGLASLRDPGVLSQMRSHKLGLKAQQLSILRPAYHDKEVLWLVVVSFD